MSSFSANIFAISFLCSSGSMSLQRSKFFKYFILSCNCTDLILSWSFSFFKFSTRSLVSFAFLFDFCLDFLTAYKYYLLLQLITIENVYLIISISLFPIFVVSWISRMYWWWCWCFWFCSASVGWHFVIYYPDLPIRITLRFNANGCSILIKTVMTFLRI